MMFTKKNTKKMSAEQMCQAGLQAHKEGDFAEAAKCFEAAAEENHPVACERLGLMYGFGQYYNIDTEKEEHYLRLAADSGYSFAQARFAMLSDPYFYSDKKDRSVTLHYLRLALRQNDEFAEGVAYMTGLCGYPYDLAAAAAHFRKMLEVNDDDAIAEVLFNVTAKLSEGGLDAEDYDEIFMLARFLADRENVDALAIYANFQLAMKKEDGESVEDALNILRNCVEKQSALAMNFLGKYLYENDEKEDGLALLQKAAELKNCDAMHFLALQKLNDMKARMNTGGLKNSTEELNIVLEEFQKAADAGNNEAHYYAARIFQDYDPLKAAEHYFKGALQMGDASMEELGAMYEKGFGNTKSSMKHAIAYYQDAIAHGNTRAHMPLGMAFLEGNGVDRDPVAAFGHFMAAAMNGIADGMYHVGRLLCDGEQLIGFSNEEEGMKWLGKAIGEGQLDAMMFCWKLFNRDAEDLSKEEREKHDQLLFDAAELGEPEAQLLVGVRYLNGFGVEIDPGKALEYFERSAAQGEMESVYWLGFMYANGIGVKNDPERAEFLFRKAADSGNMRAQYEYGKIMYAQKEYVPAYHFFDQSQSQDYVPSMKMLAQMFENGEGVAKHPEIAAKLRKRIEEIGEDEF